ncbi:MAG: ice-binding family protein, partial [Bryocella sp.]
SVVNQGLGDNVYYQVGSSATLGTGSTFAGDIIANTSISLTTGANITCGSAIALHGAVTMDTNNINNCSSNGSDVTSSAGTVAVTPEPASIALLASGLIGIFGVMRRKAVKTVS